MTHSVVLESGQKTSLLRVAPFFIGRRQQLAVLERPSQEAIQGQPRIILIEGEAGIGKTRLLKELRAVAQRYGVLICSGRCYDDIPLSYLSFLESLHAQLEQVSGNLAESLSADLTV